MALSKALLYGSVVQPIEGATKPIVPLSLGIQGISCFYHPITIIYISKLLSEVKYVGFYHFCQGHFTVIIKCRRVLHMLSVAPVVYIMQTYRINILHIVHKHLNL